MKLNKRHCHCVYYEYFVSVTVLLIWAISLLEGGGVESKQSTLVLILQGRVAMETAARFIKMAAAVWLQQ